MKIKENQIAVFEEVFEIGYGDEKRLEPAGYIYFPHNSEYLGNLRRNSKFIEFHNGNNWVKRQIRFVKVIQFDEAIEIDSYGSPAYSYISKYKIGAKILRIQTSNCSGTLTPFYV